MAVDIEKLYAILRGWARDAEPQTYTELSHAYHAATGEWNEPHGSWDRPLGALNNRVSRIGAPAIFALVINKASGEPGGSFWASAPNVPRRPADQVERVAEWSSIVEAVSEYEWPEACPARE